MIKLLTDSSYLISGDFDSVEPSILEYYRSKGVPIIPTPDQNDTDFGKALIELNKHVSEKRKEVRIIQS